MKSITVGRCTLELVVGDITAEAVDAIVNAANNRTSLQLAIDHDCQSLALPALSTGAYGYPLAQAAPIAVGTARKFLELHQRPQRVRFVLFSDDAYRHFLTAALDVEAP
jgi:O-acetyl-ADP-ribose deacetylase (regulator of RNase III)